jgi:hypothetical protein
MFPHLFNQWRGEALSRGEREIRDELGSQPSYWFKRANEKAQNRLRA